MFVIMLAVNFTLSGKISPGPDSIGTIHVVVSNLGYPMKEITEKNNKSCVKFNIVHSVYKKTLLCLSHASQKKRTRLSFKLTLFIVFIKQLSSVLVAQVFHKQKNYET